MTYRSPPPPPSYFPPSPPTFLQALLYSYINILPASQKNIFFSCYHSFRLAIQTDRLTDQDTLTGFELSASFQDLWILCGFFCIFFFLIAWLNMHLSCLSAAAL